MENPYRVYRLLREVLLRIPLAKRVTEFSSKYTPKSINRKTTLKVNIKRCTFMQSKYS